MASENLEKSFVDAVIECDYLSREGCQAEIKLLLSLVDGVSLLGLLLRNPHFFGRQIPALVALIVEGNALAHIHTAPALLANIPPVAPTDGDLPILAFLASLIPFLPSDYVVPSEFDLSQTLTLFTRNNPDRRTWREYSDTLMLYLHRGAFDALSDPDSVRKLIEVCTDEFLWPIIMRNWNEDQQTSESTRERAIELQKKLEEHDVGPSV